MFDGTVGGSPLNTFALNGAAYNVEATGIAVSKAIGVSSLIVRRTVVIRGQSIATGKFNFSHKKSLSGKDFSRAAGVVCANRRVQAKPQNTVSAVSKFTVNRRRALLVNGTAKDATILTANKRVSANMLGTGKALNKKNRFTRRQAFKSHSVVFANSSLNIRSFSRISGAGFAKSLERLDVSRRRSAVAASVIKANQSLNSIRRMNLKWVGNAKLRGRIKLPHIRFEAIDDYRSLKNTKDIRRIVVRRTNDQLFVPADKRCAAVFRSDRSIAVPNFEEGK